MDSPFTALIHHLCLHLGVGGLQALNLLCVSQMKEDPQAGFNVETLQVCILDLIEAGTETAATTLRWGFVLLLNHPRVQGWCRITSSLLWMCG